MNVLLVNGSPHPKGCTWTALNEAARQLEKNGVETTLLQVGSKAVRGCIACGKCRETGYCIFKDDPVNEGIDLLRAADGIIVGSPVYYAGPNATLCAFRGGASATFDRLNKYFTIARMPVVASQYWNSIHGNAPEEAAQDAEGLQTMRTLGDNMAWLLKCIAAGKAAGIMPPTPEPWQATNFIR